MRLMTLTVVAVCISSMVAAVRVASAAPAAVQAVTRPAAIRACAVLAKAEVKKLAGAGDQFFDMVQPEEETLPGGGSGCAYSGIHIQIDPFTPARLDELRKQQGASWVAIPNVGDAAFFYDSKPGGGLHFGELYARAGQHVVTVQLSVRPATNSVETVRPAAVALAQAIVAKLR